MELADQHALEAEGAVSGAEIPVSPAADSASPAVSPTPEKPLSVREQISKSIETVRSEEAKRARDLATGKFTKTDAPAEKPAAAEIPKTEQNATPAASTAEAPPSAWKPLWDKLPEEARAIAIKREAEVAKGFDEYRSKTAQLQEISQIFEPMRPLLQQQGITSDAQAVKSLVQWENAFRNPQTRVGAFHNLAKQYGVDLSTLAQSPSAAPSTAQDIPEHLRPVFDQFGSIAQSVQTLQSRLDQTDAQRTQSDIAAFAKDKPHFAAVSVLMGQLMQAGTAMDLDGAYQQALKIHPEVSVKVEAERLAKDASERERAQAEKAAAARRAAVSPAGRSPNGAPVNGTASPKSGTKARDSILAAITELREGQRA